MDPTVALSAALAALRPGAQWALRGPTLADLEWLDTEQAVPTQSEIDAEIAAQNNAATIPQSISRRQFYQQCAIAGITTQDEAIAVIAVGTLPAALANIVATMPADQQFAAKMMLIGSSTFERTHPMTLGIGAAYGWTPAQIDAFFTAAYAL